MLVKNKKKNIKFESQWMFYLKKISKRNIDNTIVQLWGLLFSTVCDVFSPARLLYHLHQLMSDTIQLEMQDAIQKEPLLKRINLTQVDNSRPVCVLQIASIQ